MATYNEEGMLVCPPKVSERWFRKNMGRTEKVEVNGKEFELQSVSAKWYLDHNDRCGMNSDRKDTSRYIDGLIKNVVISPPEVAHKGLMAFEDDIETMEQLARAIETFLRPGTRPEGGKTKGAKE